MTQYTESVPNTEVPTSEFSLVEAEYHTEDVEAKSAMLPGLPAPASEEDTLSQEKEDSLLLTSLKGRSIRYERLKMEVDVAKRSKFSVRYYFGCPLSVLALFALGLVWSTTVYYYWQDSVDDCQNRAEDEVASSTMAASAVLDDSNAEVKSDFDSQMRTLSDAIVILKDQTTAEFEQISISAGFCAEPPSQDQSCAQQADFVVTCYSTTSTSVEVKEVIRNYQASICERAKASTTSFEQLNDLIRGFQIKNAQVNAKQRETFQAFGTEQVQQSYDAISVSSDTSDENIIQSAGLSGGVAVALLVVCMWASMFLSKALTLPLQAISADMEAVADFTFNDMAQLRTSHVSEVYNLGTKYTYLKAALLTFSKFIPKTVIAQVVKGDERMLGPYLEKKEVSILMADLANFTNISEQIGLSSTKGLMLEFLSAMETVVESSGGVIGDFSGNGKCIP
ncbi:hypothetical protein CYMTET_38661 [Cymbomonas tetramitiformis]|uniref:Guanylate cyclase domain-containing protein n=1 Tax=Cymbomonas tetramitiformis TaxID=36881 RepID=A0AAE0CDN8_9CHLO|nr:hypothetical protein CYMTET_38661 [Cymbomonas tetramitiformis]